MIQKLDIPRWNFRVGRSFRALPSWLISLGVHVLLGVGLLFQFERQGIPDGFGDGTHRQALNLVASFSHTELPNSAGAEFTTEIVQKNESPNPVQEGNVGSPDHQEAPPEADQALTAADNPTDPPPQEMNEEEGPAEPLPQPAINEPDSNARRLIQRSALVASLLASSPQNPLPDSGEADGNGRDLNAAGGGRGERFGSPDGTSFFQVRAQGQHFCYVVDCSSSMEDGDTIGAVRSELKASLQRLDASRRFQILFYDSELHPLTDGRKSIFFATDANRRLARQFIDGQQPTGRALHQPALLAALQSKPDVIFFLTDGEVPELSARDLYELKSSNRSRTRIHVIEFGNGAKLETNWLEKLAGDHRGIYRYENIDAQ